MNTNSQHQMTALILQWRARAKRFMDEAEFAQRSTEIVRLTAMASTLEWAASDLSWFVQSPPATPLVERSPADAGS